MCNFFSVAQLCQTFDGFICNFFKKYAEFGLFKSPSKLISILIVYFTLAMSFTSCLAVFSPLNLGHAIDRLVLYNSLIPVKRM